MSPPNVTLEALYQRFGGITTEKTGEKGQNLLVYRAVGEYNKLVIMCDEGGSSMDRRSVGVFDSGLG
jgi:hypothetical protein